MLATAVHTVTVRWSSVDAAVEMWAERSGPVMAARAQLEQAGTWPQAAEALAALVVGDNQATDGTVAVPVPYLLVTASRR